MIVYLPPLGSKMSEPTTQEYRDVNTSSLRRVAPAAVALTVGLTLSACGNNSSGGGGSSTLTGGGSTAQGVAQDAWRAAFQKAHSGKSITYEQVGSGTGVTNFTSGTYAFAGSDAYLSGSSISDAKSQCNGQNAIEVPDYISPIALAYNLSGVKSLNLSSDVVAQIFDGKITKWNDPKIAAENQGVHLPSTAITPLHRSDSSGTTWNFTDYLHQTSGGEWKWAANEDWPTAITVGQGFEGTSGVAGGIAQTPGAIGYIDNSAVTGSMGAAKIKVGNQWNAPSAAGASNVIASSKTIPGRPTGDMALNIDRTSTAKGAYPLLLASYLIACPTYKDSAQGSFVKEYLTYVVSPAGQKVGAQAAKSATLPPAMGQQATQIVSAIK
jgi:phosphate transport system substrate-binding protein